VPTRTVPTARRFETHFDGACVSLFASELESFLSAEVKRALVRSKWYFGMVNVALWYDQSGTLVGQSGALGGQSGALVDQSGALGGQSGALADQSGALVDQSGTLVYQSGTLVWS